MQHLTGILIYSNDLPASFIEILKINLKDKINIQVESEQKNFKSKIEDYNLYIVNYKYIDLLEDDLLKIVVLNSDIEYCIDDQSTTVIFDPFKNETRSKKDFNLVKDTFLKTVEHSLKLFRIPVSPNDSVQTIIALD
jgi:hypothetical protein